MIQESSADKRQSLYLYTGEDSYEPLARIDRTGNQQEHIYYFHTDLNGMPEELTDEAGDIVWEYSYQLWGKQVQEIAHREIQQNLRYQGQYSDRETGLHYNTFRYYDLDTGRFTQPDPIGLVGGYNLYQYAPNAFMWIDPLGLSGENIFIHYTDKAGLESIMNTGVIEPNSKGKVYVTDILMTPRDAMRDIFINDPIHTGRGDYAIIFKVDNLQMGNIIQSSELEYIHSGRLKLGEIFHAGKNPYGIFSHLSYEQRLKMNQEQIKSRGNGCG
ncbi:RHS repeat domain-containing protein [Snodgrassella alvi]|uniref:RHS repeat domain-containing protein n=1 Tax=Snodgrassella alvi TaxID=1196083 RepID=UPI001C0D9218|nr:RHS repeat-associated core domain-containing protein [Snodgrassella alvi]